MWAHSSCLKTKHFLPELVLLLSCSQPSIQLATVLPVKLATVFGLVLLQKNMYLKREKFVVLLCIGTVTAMEWARHSHLDLLDYGLGKNLILLNAS